MFINYIFLDILFYVNISATEAQKPLPGRPCYLQRLLRAHPALISLCSSALAKLLKVESRKNV